MKKEGNAMRVNINTASLVVVAGVTTIMLATVTVFAVRLQSPPIEQPAVVTAVAPAFPPSAVLSNTSGKLVVEVQVDAAGIVTEAKVVEGDTLFRAGKKIYEATARRWRFAKAKGGAGLRTARLTFVFKIMTKDTPPDELTAVFMPPYQVEVRHKPFVPVIDRQASKK